MVVNKQYAWCWASPDTRFILLTEEELIGVVWLEPGGRVYAHPGWNSRSYYREWRYMEWLPVIGTEQQRWIFAIPLWLVLLAGAVPTIVLWYRDRRPSPGHCKSCNYNLTANTSGTCPECGQPLPRTAPT